MWFFLFVCTLQVGDKVQKGQVVCIIEAMKLMNEIEVWYSLQHYDSVQWNFTNFDDPFNIYVFIYGCVINF